MACPNCKICGAKMMKNGKTSAGRQRWRCGECGSSFVRKIDSTAKWLASFVRWLTGKLSQSELGVNPRRFRKKTSSFWKIWPIIPICDEIYHVVYMDGIWLSRKCVVLIACTDKHVIGCHLARTENSRDWGCLVQRISPPDVLVCDGLVIVPRQIELNRLAPEFLRENLRHLNHPSCSVESDLQSKQVSTKLGEVQIQVHLLSGGTASAPA